MKKRIFAIVLTVVLSLSLAVPCFASDGGSTGGTADYDSVLKPLFDKILGQLSVGTIVGLLAGVLGAGMVFVFMWWAIRKGIGILMSAIRKGKVSS